MKRLFFFGALCAATAAHASGFYFGDNGVKAVMQGGAFTAQADDLTATQYNPAGLTQLRGFSFLADLQLVRHQVSFLRQDPGWDVNDPRSPRPDLISTVLSSASPTDANAPYLLPYFGLSYGLPLGERTLALALSLFAPPSQGAYYYPEPNYTKDADGRFVESPARFAPQRYALVSTDILIAYPSLSAAIDVVKWLQVGLTLQLTVSHFKQQQVLYGGDVLGDNPQRQLQENPDYDARVGIDLPGQVGVTAIGGVMLRPTDWLSFGVSVRPPIPFRARGAVSVDLPEYFTNTAGARVDGPRTCGPKNDQLCADLTMTLPLEVRIGARVLPVRHACALGDSTRLDCGLGVNADFVYQGWNSVDKLQVTPDGVEVVANLAGTESRIPIKGFAVEKNWVATYSARVGASYRLFQYLSASAGFMYETAAATQSSFSVDWTHPARFFVTGGLTGHLGPIDVIAGIQGTPTQTVDITESAVLRAGTTNPGDPGYSPGLAVGNGRYTSGGFAVLLGVRGNFNSLVPQAAAPIEPSTAPSPAPVEAAPAAPAE